MKNSSFFYSVGALLYCPANSGTISDSIIHNKIGGRFSLALCLEDTIHHRHVLEAEQKMLHSLTQIYRASQEREFFIPKIFVRVRNPEQMLRLYREGKTASSLITGFIAPKFSLENADNYLRAIWDLNAKSSKPLYMMPIYESASIVDLRARYDILYSLKDRLDAAEDRILNIRVGGNDLCHLFGFRRRDNESIHRIKPVAHIFSDINTVYGLDYVISGPVWEYYNGENWKNGLMAEIDDDRLCGFIGKTVIHPKQIDVVNSAYAVSKEDYSSAKAILGWDRDAATLVSSDPRNKRMDEYKTHTNWAKKILFLAECYGIQD